jgi:hypothetical protein
VNTPRGDPFTSPDGEEEAMRNMMLTAAALVLVTVLAGCATYPTYGYTYGPGYGYVPNAYATYPGSYAYRYAPLYTPDYNGYFDTYRSHGGGNS